MSGDRSPVLPPLRIVMSTFTGREPSGPVSATSYRLFERWMSRRCALVVRSRTTRQVRHDLDEGRQAVNRLDTTRRLSATFKL